MSELNFWQNEGIIINGTRVYFQLAGILGDNLEIHETTGFMAGFRANYPCRHCLVHRSQLNDVHREEDCVLKDVDNYQVHASNIQPSKTGINERCTFNDVDGFHVTENPIVDVMHDLLEGVVQYDLALILYYIIFILKRFPPSQLNERLRGFNVGINDKNCKPPQLDENQLNNKKLQLSPAETLCLIRYIGLIIGDLIPPEYKKYWKLVCKLKKIIDIVTSLSFDIRILPLFD